MEVIMEQEVPALGKPGDVVNVARGYANNYLLPRGLAVRATPGNLKQLEQKRAAWAKKGAAAKAEAEQLAATFAGKEVVVESRAGATGKLFGSVTAKDIAQALSEQHNLEIDRRKIELSAPIKDEGTREVKVRLHHEVEPTVQVKVVALREEEPAETE